MAKDQKRRQDKIMKKKRKDKARARQRQKTKIATSASSIIRRARDYPIYKCWITPGWRPDESGIATLIVTRTQPNGSIAWGAYLIDLLCLGVKDATANANFSLSDLNERVLPGMMQDMEPEEIAPDLAHQIIYQAIDFADQFGLKPHKDFALARHILEPRGTFEETHALTFGREGKPLFIPGPDDNIDAILARLDKHAGPGNYDYSLPVGDTQEIWDDDNDLDDDDFDEDPDSDA